MNSKVNTWTAPPRAPTPEGMFFCKVLGQNITFCGRTEHCHVKNCAAREVIHNDNEATGQKVYQR